MEKIGRNNPCICGSNKKYKKCCGDPAKTSTNSFQPNTQIPIDEILKAFEKKQVAEKIRKQQQGLGKPIISDKFKGHQFVAVGSKLWASKEFRTFPDFLHFFMFEIFGRDWFSQQEKIATIERHPIATWVQKIGDLKELHCNGDGDTFSLPMTGAVNCYLGLAYSLYLLNHNIELQQKLVNRLKNIDNFQGAYYEVLIANCLITSGFTVHLEDESDNTTKHCEYYAVSYVTKKRYSIEAKMRSVAGMLGATDKNGTSVENPTGQLTKHINLALKKPSNGGERIIFVDINSPEPAENALSWIEKAAKKLEQKENDSPADLKAFIFITNLNFHWTLDSDKNGKVVFAHGLGIDDFAKKGNIRLFDYYKQKQKYKDLFDIFDAFKPFPKIPQTFDGSLPSELFNGKSQPIKIGERYFFPDIGENGLEATVTTATVAENEKLMYIGTDSGNVITRPMTDAEVADFRNHREYFFGKYLHHAPVSKNSFEFFDELVKIHLSYSPESNHKKLKTLSDYEELKNLPYEDLVLIYCERIVHQTTIKQPK